MPENWPLAVILAGGHGECLRLENDYVPKLLLPLGEKPLLEHQLAWLSRHGFQEVALCLGYKADAVRSYFGDGSRFGVRLRYLVEEAPLGTAGAIKALGPASLPEDILVLDGDVYPDTDAARMLQFHRDRRAAATLAVHDCGPGEEHRECRRVVFGPLRAIVDFPDYHDPPQGVGVSPLWIISRFLLHLAGEAAPSDFLRDVFPVALRRGELLVGCPETGLLADLGSLERYVEFKKLWEKKTRK